MTKPLWAVSVQNKGIVRNTFLIKYVLSIIIYKNLNLRVHYYVCDLYIIIIIK